VRVLPAPAPAQVGGGALGAALLVGAALGSAVYAVVVSVMARWPGVLHARGSGGAARPALVAVVAVPLAIAGVVLFAASRPAPARNLVAMAWVGFGAAWVAWGLVEQHLLGTFVLAPGAAAAGEWDAMFHAVGLVMAGVGTSLLSAGGQRGPST